MKDRREKELCYYCDVHWNSGHKCQNPRFFFIEEVGVQINEEMLTEALEGDTRELGILRTSPW